MFKQVTPSKLEPFIAIGIGIGVFFIVYLLILGFDKVNPFNEQGTTTATSQQNSETKADSLGTVTYKASDVRVIDGDTVAVMNSDTHKEVSVRLLYIDTPESVHPTKNVQAYGKKASQYAKDLVKHAKKVSFVVTGKDRYDRTLALVKIDGVSLEELMLKSGLAKIAYVNLDKPSESDVVNLYKKEQLALFKQAESSAKKQKLRIWQDPSYIKNNDFSEFKKLDEIPNPVVK